MTNTERHIVETYSGILDNLSSSSKLELIENLAKSIRKDKKSKEKEFYKSFGAFGSEKSAEEIANEIKAARKFSNKDL